MSSNDEAPDVGFCLTLFGPAGGGKTSLASSCAKFFAPRRVLLADAEGGSKVVRGLYPNLDIAKLTRWSQFDNLTQLFVQAPTSVSIKDGKFTIVEPDEGYAAVILDNLAEYQNLSIRSVQAGETPTQPEWGRSTADILNKIRTWRDLATLNDLTVIFITWDVDEKDEGTGINKKHVAFTPSLQRQFPGIVDSIGHVSAPDRHPDVRVLDFTPGPRTVAKFRRAPTSEAMKIPYKMQYGLDDMPLSAILSTLRGGDWPSNRYTPQQQQQQSASQS